MATVGEESLACVGADVVKVAVVVLRRELAASQQGGCREEGQARSN